MNVTRSGLFNPSPEQGLLGGSFVTFNRRSKPVELWISLHRQMCELHEAVKM